MFCKAACEVFGIIESYFVCYLRYIHIVRQPVTDNKVNLYFGNRLCLDAVKTFVHKPLNELSPEEDFMLGAMLGYDITGQCERYCKRKVRTA